LKELKLYLISHGSACQFSVKISKLSKSREVCEIWGSFGSGYEVCCLLGCDSM